ncbi:hypothetical protein V2G26_015504 [Clonostachys chloroleuca]
MPLTNVVILGAGPCGLSAAIALAKSCKTVVNSQPLRITVIELRPRIQTIGGTVNMTPLGMRYLDYLGAGERLRSKSISLDHGVDAVSLRTGKRLGNVWGGIGARRTARYPLVDSLLETVTQDHQEHIEVQWGRKVTNISEKDEQVHLEFEDHSTMHCDLLLGCDGIHSSARRLYIEPERQKIFTGRAVAMGWVELDAGEASDDIVSPIMLSTGEPGLVDTAVVNGNGNGRHLIMTYFEPSRRNIFFGHVMWTGEPEGEERDGWKLRGDDKEAIRKEVVESYRGGRVNGLDEFISKCESWDLYPIYSLPPGGRWSRGRVLLLGDAAHAMPPQGESTGIAIEDGVLIARILEQSDTKSIDQMFADYEKVRRVVIDKHYVDAERMAKFGFSNTTGLAAIAMEWITSAYMFVRKWNQTADFAGDVRELELPGESENNTE